MDDRRYLDPDGDASLWDVVLFVALVVGASLVLRHFGLMPEWWPTVEWG